MPDQRASAHTEASSAMSQNKLLTRYTTLSLLTLLLLFHIPLISSASSSKQAIKAHGCQNKRCGSSGRVDVSYPFALDNQPECLAFSDFFRLQCNETISKVFINIITSSKLFINTTSGYSILHATLLEVTSITSDSLVIDIGSVKASLSPAFNKSYCGVAYSGRIYLPPYPGPFLISKDNQFRSSSCSYASYYTANITNNSSISLQYSAVDSDSYYDYNYTIVESCSCVDLCKLEDLKCQNVSLNYPSRFAYQYVDDPYSYSAAITTCSALKGGFATFFHPNFTDFTKEPPLIQLQLTWALPSNSASHYSSACSPDNSNITIVQGVPGYRCFCKPGYAGDGYLHGSGCNDIKECSNDTTNDCIYGRKHCQESPTENYTCSCNSWIYVGDGRRSGSGCHFSHSLKLAFVISIATGGFFLIIGSFVYLAFWWGQRTKRKYFVQNGGLQMQTYLRTRQGREMTRLFTAEELKGATNNYAEDMKIGEGGFGVVFKGMLNDGRLVAIKKSKIMGSKLDGADSQQFLNEMAILTQINHRHIVRLLGFCLETEAPLLVYEYVSNGNLAENLEGKRGKCVMQLSWEQRLKVARQTAEALAYLHAAASPPILHRDVKSSNVLLDDNMDAKIIDFGLSRLVPDGVKHVSTVVQGTIGYLDPEYFQTLQLTDKSDVYSLGVMLAELITSLKPVDIRNREPCFANLALLFIHRMEEGKLDELIDVRLSTEASGDAALRIHSSITAVAALARQCLALEGCKRPSMSQVVDDLRHISRALMEARGIEGDDEATPLLYSSATTSEKAVDVESHYQYSSHSGSVDNIVFNSFIGGR